MRVLQRLFFAAALLFLGAVVIVAGTLAFLIGSDTGNRFLRDRTQGTIARLLGPGYVTDLGQQTFEIRADGTLAVGWNDVRLTRVDDASHTTNIERAALAIRLLPLVGGGLEFGRLEIEGARIDVAPLLQGREQRAFAGLNEIAGETVDALERQLGALNAFRFETIAFQDITIDGLPPAPGGLERLHLDFAELRRRGGSGALDLSAALSLGPIPLSLTGEAAFSTAGSLDSFSLRSSPASLAVLLPPSTPAQIGMEPPFATDSDLSATFRIARSGDTGRLVSDLHLTAGPGVFQMGRNVTRIEEMQLRLRHLEGEERLEIVPSPMRFTSVAFALGGELVPDADDAQRIRFALDAPQILSRAGQAGQAGAAEPLVGALKLAGSLNPSATRAELDEIAFTAGASSLAGSGALDLSAPDARSHLSLEAERVDAPAAKAFWPFNLAGRARHWILDHLGDQGVVTSGEIALDVRRDRFAGAFGREGRIEPQEMRIALQVEDADMTTPGELPAVYNGNGRVLVEGGRTSILVENAMVEGHSAVAIGASTLTLERDPEGERRETRFEIDVEAAGALDQLLAIADSSPIRALRTIEFEPSDASGTGQVKAYARLRLGDGVPPADILRDWSAQGELADAALGVPIEGRRFAGLAGHFSVGPGAARADLTGRMDEMPAQIALTMPVGPEPSVERLIEIGVEVSQEKATEIVPALRGSLEGPIAAKITQDSAGLRASLDLARTSLSIPTLAWTKGRGIGATLDVDVAQAAGETRLDNLRIAGSGFSAAGSAVIDAQGLRSARLTDVALNPGDSIALAMDRTGNGFSMEIEGTQFDARPLLQELRASAGRQRAPNASGLTFDIAASVDRVRGFDERTLNGIALNYASLDGRLAALSVAGRTGAGDLRIDLSPRESGQSIRMTTEDLGAFIGFAGLYGNMEQGSAVLDLIGAPDGTYQGLMTLRDFTLVDEPRLERFVGTEPVAGQGTLSQALGRDLRTSRAFFDQASAVLYYGDGALSVTNGIIRGPVFGSSFAGTLYDRDSRILIAGSFMPAYSVNRLFGSIPLVGRILGNGIEGGLLGITYQLSGAFASPTLTVNPISLIAPGVFRQIFEY